MALLSRRRLLLGGSAALALSTAGCAPRRPVPGRYASPPIDVTGKASLRAQAASHGLLAGFALGTASLRQSDPYRRVAAAQCSIAVAENAMKWGALRPAAGQFSFDDADVFVQFCGANHIKMRGHNLCWHEYLPAWLVQSAMAENARALLQEHIRTVAGRYRGRMHSWDVVNEAIEIKDGRADGLRSSLWLRLMGEDYVETAFRTAREADPSALLTYNDFGMEGETDAEVQKRAAVLLLLRRLRQRNVPIDAVGIQSHLDAGARYRNAPGLRRFIQSCREMNLEVFLTEMDVDDRKLPADPLPRDTGVAETYASYLQTVLAEPNVRAVLAWGVDDTQTWLNQLEPRSDGKPQRSLLFDAQFHAKPAFAAVSAAFAVHTEAATPKLPVRLTGRRS